jgi:molecular chaperone GrpE
MSKEGRHDEIEDPAVQPTEIPAEENGNELQSFIERLQRLQAEFENYKKRTAREIATLEERVADQVILDFLTPYENLERAFRSYESDEDIKPFVSGVEQIFAQFAQILEQRGVERIPAVGDPFDPALHEALLTAPSEQERNTIIEEFTPGYRREGRVLRASKVAVSQGPAVQEEQA